MSIELTTISDADRRGIVSALAADPTPHATDNDKLLSSPTIGEVVVITDEASRIERFVGNLADPSKFFIAGFEPVEVEIAESPVELDPNGYYFDPAVGEYSTASSYFTFFADGDPETYPWKIYYDGYILWTADQIVATPQEVTSWTANDDYPELEEVAAPTITAWDNSGFILNNDTPYAPVDILNGRIAYADSGGGTLTYDPNLGWKDVNDVVIGADDVVYPWLIEEPSDPLTGPRPAANNDNWAVLRNTVELTAEVAVEGDGGGTVNGVRIEEGSSAFVGWVDPLSVPLDLDGNAANIQQYSNIPGAENNVQLSGYVNGSGPQLYPLPLAVQPRESVYVYFSF